MKHPTITDNRVLRLNVGFLLKEGAGYVRDFDFEVSRPIRADDVLINKLHGTLRLTRTPQGILVQGTLAAQSTLECVRCLTEFEFPYAVEISELFVPELTEQPRGADDPGPYIIEETGFIDLTPILREESILAIPIQALCFPDCKGLCPHCGQDLNQGPCGCEDDHSDPRLASLRSLLGE